MMQKEAMIHALAFAQSPFAGNPSAGKAARAFCLISWLHDMNWHPEADALESKVLAAPYLASAYRKLETDTAITSRLDCIGALMNCLYGWGLTCSEWRATAGAPLVQELWKIINSDY